MLRLIESFDAYATAQLPALHKWTTATGVTIATNEGRSGLPGDNAAFFDTALGAVLSTPISVSTVAGLSTVTYGIALRMVSVASAVIVGSIQTSISRFDLVVTSLGRLRLLQTTGGVLLGTIAESEDGIVPIGSGGCYVEVQIIGSTSQVCTIRVSDQFGDMNPLAVGPVFAWTAPEVPITAQLGSALNVSPAQWYADDVYLTDGVPTTVINYQGLRIRNDSFLGNVHVQAFYATADGANLIDPWIPSSGPTAFNLINEHPPDEDATYISADHTGQLTTCLFGSDLARPFGRLGCEAQAPLFGLQWVGRIRKTSDDTAAVYAVVRRLITGTLATDDVEISTPITIETQTYLYYLWRWDRNPTLALVAWLFDVFFPAGVGIPGTTEFGAEVA